MTREDIVKAAEEYGWPKGEVADIIDFAEAMVRRHNEECQELGRQYHYAAAAVVAIREAKP